MYIIHIVWICLRKHWKDGRERRMAEGKKGEKEEGSLKEMGTGVENACLLYFGF